MSENDKKDSKSSSKGRRSRRQASELDEFRVWLASLGHESPPRIHVNGAAYTTAVLAVDFGTPLVEPAKLTSEQSAELINHMRATTRALCGDRDITMRVQNDANTGIWWSTVA